MIEELFNIMVIPIDSGLYEGYNFILNSVLYEKQDPRYIAGLSKLSTVFHTKYPRVSIPLTKALALARNSNGGHWYHPAWVEFRGSNGVKQLFQVKDFRF